MPGFSYRHSSREELVASGTLDDMLQYLHIGDIVPGRVLDRIGENRYLIRIRGCNILTESKRKLRPSQEVSFRIGAVHPRLKLDLQKADNSRTGKNRTDVRV